MATIPEIKTNLFSFKTFRSPDKIDPLSKELFFIEHPELTASHFNKCPLPDGQPISSLETFNAFLAELNVFNNYKDIKALDTEFFNYSSALMKQKKNDSSKEVFKMSLPNPMPTQYMLRVWDNLFYQVATQKSDSVRHMCIQIILTQHFVENNSRLELKDLSKLTILIPDLVYNCFKPWYYDNCGGKLFGVHNLGIQEYRRVEQTLCCYVPGEVSHIENIMAKEYKEKSTRNLLRTENTIEFSSETEIENINDTTSTERNELSSETAKELNKDKSFDISGSVTVSKDTKLFGAVSANVSSGYSSSNSSTLSNTEAKNYAKEITERALERVVQRTSEKRTFKMIKEFEENNKHGFDNRLGEKHVTGVYRWVDKIYDNQLVNYGRRLLFESDVPHPAAFYKKALLWKSKEEEESGTELVAPKTLSEFGINSAGDIKSDNLLAAATYYGVTIDDYESQTQYVSVDIPYTEVQDKTYTQSLAQPSVTIPTGFVAERLDGVGTFNYNTSVWGGSGSAYIEFDFSGYKSYQGDYTNTSSKTFDYHFIFGPQLSGSISFVVKYRNGKSFSGSFQVKCVSDPSMYTEWQQTAFAELQTAYQAKLDKYNEDLELQQAALEALQDQEGSGNYSNPALNRLIEERELKRICIEMMSKPFCYELGKTFNQCNTYRCNTECSDNEAVIPDVVQNQALEDYAKFIKFFETAFQWEIMSYVFYPYYYNQKCDWPELLQTKNDDPIFEAFLQSGMAKLLIPVRPQFEKAVMYFMETGQIYFDGDLVPETADDRYESLLEELGNQDEIKVEGTWQTRIPSTLTIIQANSTYLEDEKGLPCCEEDLSIFGKNDLTLSSINPE